MRFATLVLQVNFNDIICINSKQCNNESFKPYHNQLFQILNLSKFSFIFLYKIIYKNDKQNKSVNKTLIILMVEAYSQYISFDRKNRPI